MEIDVGLYIAEVLHQKEAVSVPGLGDFETKYKSAVADQVQGKMLPPGKELFFKKNTSGQNVFLTKYIKEKYALSYADAQKVVGDYVNDLQDALENKEIVVFPNVGRLYKDFEQSLKFLPDRENFDKTSFGLPATELFPLLREESQIVPSKKKAEPASVASMAEGPTWFQRNVISIAAISITVLGFVFYYIFLQSGFLGGRKSNVNWNQSPSEEVKAANPLNKSEFQPADIQFNPAQSGSLATDSSQESPSSVFDAQEPPKVQPKAYLAEISIREFEDETAADRMTSTLIKEGHKAFVDKTTSKNRVIVEVEYDSKEELNKLLKKLRNHLKEPDAYVLKERAKQ